MKKTIFKNEKGISGIILMVLAALVLLGVFFYFKQIIEMESNLTSVEVQNDGAQEFKEMPAETEATPEEVNNETVDELDELMMSIDAEAESETLLDLEY